MSSRLIKNIGQLITNSDENLGIINNAALVVDGGKVVWIGENSKAPSSDTAIDANQGVVAPGFVDSHTHAVFAGDRHKDYVARMSGEKYASGGIKTTVAATRAASKVELTAHTKSIVDRARKSGTTTIEIKSGYGLDVETEKKILEVAKEFTTETTYLGAHVVPNGIDRNDYLKLVTGEMLDACAPLAKWIDVFCDSGAFTVDEAREIIKAGQAKGLIGRIHGNQLGESGGAELAAEMKLASVDHCTFVTDAALEKLASAGVVATLLPGAEFFTKSKYPDAKRYFAVGVKVALATDCNPGSSYLTSMPIVMSLAIREMGFTPAQAFYSATKVGADALQRNDIGHLTVGAKADINIWNCPSFEHIAYRMGEIDLIY
ncbi:MAG: hypothetical protein RLZ57_156 [Actinomycetota bacterium]|jgi:imidazolonepropionase